MLVTWPALLHCIHTLRPTINMPVNWVIIDSDNGLAPAWCQAIVWTDVDLLSIGPLGTNFSEIKIKTQNFSTNKIHLKLSSAKCLPSYSGFIASIDGQVPSVIQGPWCIHFLMNNTQAESHTCLLAPYSYKLVCVWTLDFSMGLMTFWVH